MTDSRTSKDRVEFERWLFDTQGLESVWEPHRNCHKDFAAHLAFKAWQAARSAHEPRKDHCEVCDKELPHPDEWSMPSCPDCQEVLEFLGELMADYADREREGKAELVSSAIKLITRRASQPPSDDEPSVMGGAVHPIPPPPTGVDRIEWHVREIQKICDALNLDPVQWLMPDLENDVPEGPSPTKGDSQ